MYTATGFPSNILISTGQWFIWLIAISIIWTTRPRLITLLSQCSVVGIAKQTWCTSQKSWWAWHWMWAVKRKGDGRWRREGWATGSGGRSADREREACRRTWLQTGVLPFLYSLIMTVKYKKLFKKASFVVIFTWLFQLHEGQPVCRSL